MSTYDFEVPNVDIVNKINKLTTRINQDIQVTLTLINITFSDPILSVIFSASLNFYELRILSTMIKSIFLDKIAGESFEFNNVVRIPRNIDRLSYIPTPTDDVHSGYNAGSSVYDSLIPAMYVCVDNTENNAVWVRCDNLPTNICTAGSTITSTIPSTVTAINPTDIIFSSPAGNWTFDGSGRLTTNISATYRISFTIQVEVVSLTTIGAYISINGSGSVAGSERSIQLSSGIAILSNNVTYANITAGDYIQIIIQADTALSSYSTTTINGVTNYSIMLSLEQV